MTVSKVQRGKRVMDEEQCFIRYMERRGRKKRQLEFQAALAPQPCGAIMNFLAQIQGEGLTCIGRKVLKISDVDENLRRLFLTEDCALLLAPYMEPEERSMLNLRSSSGLPVVLVGPDGRRWENVILDWWPSVKQHVLKHGWLNFVNWYGLHAGLKFRFWAFRYGLEKKLGLAMDLVAPDPGPF